MKKMASTNILRSLSRLQQLMKLTSEKFRVGPSSTTPLVSCFRISDHVSPTRLFVDTVNPDTLLAFRGLVRDRTVIALDSATTRIGCATARASKKLSEAQGLTVATSTAAREKLVQFVNQVNITTRLASVGQNTLLLIRSPVARAQLARLSQALRPSKRRPSALIVQMNGSAGMILLAADVNRNKNSLMSDPQFSILSLPSLDKSLWQMFIKLFCSEDGPRQIGIGWIPPKLQTPFIISLFSSVFILITTFFPVSMLCIIWGLVILASLTKPDIESFIAWTKEKAPQVAKTKTAITDKLRAYIAPYMLEWIGDGPAISDYGVVSVVTVKDAADFVYVYVGGFTSWLLLGWYNAEDEYEYGIIPKHLTAKDQSLQST